MEERFDEKLSAHIRNVFDNYEDYAADEGWNKLLEKQEQPQKERKAIPLWYWLSPAVAALFAFFALNLNMLDVNKTTPRQAPLVANKVKTKQASAKSTEEKNKVNQNSSLVDKTNTSLTIASTDIAYRNTTTNTYKKRSATSSANMLIRDDKVVYEEELIALRKQENNKAINAAPIGQPEMVLAIVNTTLPASIKIQQPDEKVKEYIAGETKRKKKDNVDIGLMAGSFMSYSKGSENNALGYKAGVDVDIPIASNVSINTGLNLGHQSLTFGNDHQLPPPLMSKMNTLYSMGTLENYKATMFAVDLPINVKVVFPSEKHSWFVTGGFSSYSYLDDSYEATYTQMYQSPNVNGATTYSTTEFTNEDNSGKLFSRFDWFRTLNMSFGIDYNLNKNKLSIEPYMKLPLGGMGSEQIKWTSAGLNLKFSFGK